MFMVLGVPVYMADDEAKKLLAENTEVRQKVIDLLGEQAYKNEKPDRTYIAEMVFNNKNLLASLNKIIHPAVKIHFESWYASQNSPYVLKEAAILFESGGYKDCFAIITVTAPEEIRINRVILRDKTTEEAVRARMKNQWMDDKKIELSDFVIQNISLEKAQNQVRKIHHELLKKLS